MPGAVLTEQQQMKQLVAAVRAVVNNVKNDDIILTLHQYDMDVARTIQALTEHGSRATDQWSTSGGAGGNKKNKKKKSGNANAQPTTSVKVINDASATNGASAPRTKQQQSANKTMPMTNGVDAPAPRTVTRDDEHVSRVSFTSHQSTELDSAHDAASKRKAIAKESSKLSKHDANIQRVSTRFESECSQAEQRMRRAFNELRTLLSDREAILAEKLRSVKEEGTRVLRSRADEAKSLYTRSLRAPQMNDEELNELRNDIKAFVAASKSEEELGTTLRFTYEPDELITRIKAFGNAHVSAGHHDVHHNDTSRPPQHSPMSGASEPDSGLGIPLSPRHQAKQTAKVDAGGIVMQSDEMSTAELEAINRALQQSLSMQGVNASVLSSLQSSTSTAPPRRRAPQGQRGGRGGARGRGGGGRGAVNTPNLSIL